MNLTKCYTRLPNTCDTVVARCLPVEVHEPFPNALAVRDFKHNVGSISKDLYMLRNWKCEFDLSRP